MFDNMTKREKVLAAAAGSLVPICILFFVLMWFLGKWDKNQTAIAGLERDIKTQKDIAFSATKAEIRREFYRSISLQSDLNVAKQQYEEWLKDAVEVRNGMDKFAHTQATLQPGKFSGQDVFNRVLFTVKCEGTLDQINSFLYDFETTGLLHNIIDLRLIPPNKVQTEGSQDNYEGGVIQVSMKIVFVSLLDAEPFKRDFNRIRLPSKDFISAAGLLTENPEMTEAELQTEILGAIAGRNIFSPGNNPPEVKTVEAGGTAGSPIAFAIKAGDPDKDLVTLELVSSELENATLEQNESRGKLLPTAQFKSDGAPIGEYKVIVRASDNGNPGLSVEQEIVVTVEEKDNARPGIDIAARGNEGPARNAFTIPFTVADDDETDTLEVLLVDSEIEGVTILPDPVNPRGYELGIPATDSGSYSINLQVTDDEIRTKLAEDPEMRAPRGTTERVSIKILASSFKEAWETQLSRKFRDGEGVETFWITFRVRGEYKEFKVGDEFELDDETWTANSFDYDRGVLVLQVGETLKHYRMGAMLSEPHKETELDGSDVAVSDTGNDAASGDAASDDVASENLPADDVVSEEAQTVESVPENEDDPAAN